MMNTLLPRRAILIPVLLVGASCGSDPGAGPSPPPPPNQASYFLLIEGPTTLPLGTKAAFAAILMNSADRSRRDIAQEVQWKSSDPARVTIDRGSAAGLLPGQATLEARFGELRATKGVLITALEGLSSAVLAIESPSIDVFPDGAAYFGYGVRFRLRETRGESSATIGDIAVHGPNGSDLTGPSCWGSPLRVPRGGTLDTFYTDEGLYWLAYCAPGSGGRTATPTLRLVVSFFDEQGRAGTVETVITRTQ